MYSNFVLDLFIQFDFYSQHNYCVHWFSQTLFAKILAWQTFIGALAQLMLCLSRKTDTDQNDQ